MTYTYIWTPGYTDPCFLALKVVWLVTQGVLHAFTCACFLAYGIIKDNRCQKRSKNRLSFSVFLNNLQVVEKQMKGRRQKGEEELLILANSSLSSIRAHTPSTVSLLSCHSLYLTCCLFSSVSYSRLRKLHLLSKSTARNRQVDQNCAFANVD